MPQNNIYVHSLHSTVIPHQCAYTNRAQRWHELSEEMVGVNQQASCGRNFESWGLCGACAVIPDNELCYDFDGILSLGWTFFAPNFVFCFWPIFWPSSEQSLAPGIVVSLDLLIARILGWWLALQSLHVLPTFGCVSSVFFDQSKTCTLGQSSTY